MIEMTKIERENIDNYVKRKVYSLFSGHVPEVVGIVYEEIGNEIIAKLAFIPAVDAKFALCIKLSEFVKAKKAN